MVECKICGKQCASNAGLGQHMSYMHGSDSNELRAARAARQQGKAPPAKGKTKAELAYLQRPQQAGKRFGISLNGHTELTKTKISNAMKGNQNANHRGDRQSYYNGIRMDSTWEVGTAKYFDRNKINWKYNVSGYTLSDGSVYYPDFFIYDGDTFIKLVEVKGYFRERNRQKFEMFKEEYPSILIELWQKPKLVDLGIINKSGRVL